MGARPCGCSTCGCGWNPINAPFDSTTNLSGTMTLTRISPSGVIRSSGTGVAVLFATAHFTGGRARLTCKFPTLSVTSLPTSGSFWFGIRSGIGVKYNFGTGRVYECTLAADGTVATVGNSAPYGLAEFDYGGFPWTDSGMLAWGPDVFVAWCHIGCDRVYVGGVNYNWNTGAPVAPPPFDYTFATVHEKLTKPTGDVTVCFGTDVDSTVPLDWLMRAWCLDLCPPCQPFSDWPTPGKAQVSGWTGSLTTINTAGRGDPNFTHLSNPLSAIPGGGSLYALRSEDAGSVAWTIKCQWANGGGGAISPTFGTTIQDFGSTKINAEVIGAVLFAGPEAPDHSISAHAGTDVDRVISTVDDSKWHLIVFYGINQKDSGSLRSYSNFSYAVYEGEMFADRSAHTFSLISVRHRATVNYVDIIGLHDVPSSDPDNAPFVDPNSWPSNLSVNWVPTAPECSIPGTCSGYCQWVGTAVGDGFAWTSVSRTCFGTFGAFGEPNCGCEFSPAHYGFGDPTDDLTIVQIACALNLSGL